MQSVPRKRGRKTFLIVAAVVAAIFLSGRTALSYYVNALWYASLGYGAVYSKTLALQWSIFVGFGLLTFAAVYGGFRALQRYHRHEISSGHTIMVNGQPLKLPIGPVIKMTALALSLLLAFITAAAMMAEWMTLSSYWYAPAMTASVVDPVFGRPIEFFLFVLPAWGLVLGWLLTLAVIGCAMAGVFLLITGGPQILGQRSGKYGSISWKGLSVAVSFLLVVLALRAYVSRYSILLEHHTIFDGATFTDTHVAVGGLSLVAAGLMLGALVAVWNAIRGGKGTWIIACFVPGAICYVGMGIVSWYVGNFVVKPNELVRERPYIAANIEMTRRAFGLDKFAQHEFAAETTVEATEPANNQPTLQNIRLWDWRALQDTLRQIQEIRTYYDFPDIDIDRYTLGGQTREVMLAARELNVEKLPESSRNWINEKLIYTHGYGLTMNPVNGFTAEGLPNLMLSNMPVQSTVPGLAVTRPEIYFGQLTDTDVYVKTRQQEFNFPQGQSNALTSYQGTGGIEVGNFLRRIAIAIDRGDLGKVPFSDDINAQSRLLMRRNVRSRVMALAPFLTFDQDPYVVIGANGRLSWILDAFTTSDSYPYSTHYRASDGSVNTIRNSVKVVVDAYDGTTTFYVFDSTDPILGVYRRIFPSLFKDATTMPAELRTHVRYPELLIKMQAEVYGLYHMTDPSVFYNREDLWTVASEVGLSEGGQQVTQEMQPNYVLMKLPGEKEMEFVEILPFTPANRNNLIGWVAGRSDGLNYGTAAVYNFPKTRLVDGPLQIEARIDQNAQLSGQLTLWNQQGSHVRRGNLLTIPTGRALLYAEPIYLQAERSPMPELRLVVLALQDRLAYGPTFEAALSSLYGGAASSLTLAESPRSSDASAEKTAPAGTSSDISGEIQAASKAFADYERLTAAGKLGEAGQKLEQLKQALDRLSHRAK